MLRVFDASSAIYAWDNYPIAQFPLVWKWLHIEIQAQHLHISEVALDEVRNISTECAEWLDHAQVNVLPVTNEILISANRFKKLLNIFGDVYGAGVGENDLLIIATASQNGFELISDENSQPTLPKVKANYKIPAVCAIPQVAVSCHSFLNYLKRSAQVFI